MTGRPERIWAWCFVESKQDDLIKGGWTDIPDKRETEYIREDLAKPKVKPLVWKDCGDGWKAHTVIGEYRTAPTANARNKKYAVSFICADRKSWTVGYIEGGQAAKAAAQADYERRILEALE